MLGKQAEVMIDAFGEAENGIIESLKDPFFV
jgi:hypothetical protein